LLSVATIQGFGNPPEEEPTAAELLAYFESDENSLYVGSVFYFIGSGLLIWFGGLLRQAIAAAGLERLATTAFGALVAVAALSMGFLAPHLGAAFGANDSDAPLSPEAAQALWFAGDGFFVAAEFATVGLMAAAGLAILRSRFVPVWLGWFSFVVALILLFLPLGWLGFVAGLPLWILLVTFFLWKQTEPVRPSPG
jgi:hypothetical protein